MGIIKSFAKSSLVPTVFLGNLATSALEKIKGEKYGRSTTAELTETKTGIALGAATGAVGVALTGASSLGRAAVAKLLPTAGRKIAASVAVLGAASASPTVASAVVGSPAAVFDFFVKTGEKIEDLPEKETENKSLLGLGLAVIGGTAAGAAITNKLVGEGKEKGKEIIDTVKETGGFLGGNDVLGSAPLTPETPQTQELTKSRRKKKKSKSLEGFRQTISQRVNVVVGGKTTNKKYISVAHLN